MAVSLKSTLLATIFICVIVKSPCYYWTSAFLNSAQPHDLCYYFGTVKGFDFVEYLEIELWNGTLNDHGHGILSLMWYFLFYHFLWLSVILLLGLSKDLALWHIWKLNCVKNMNTKWNSKCYHGNGIVLRIWNEIVIMEVNWSMKWSGLWNRFAGGNEHQMMLWTCKWHDTPHLSTMQWLCGIHYLSCDFCNSMIEFLITTFNQAYAWFLKIVSVCMLLRAYDQLKLV